MPLPILGGLAGAALAGTGVLGGITPLLASAIGSGIGAFAETGDPKDALMSGLTGYMGGSLLGNALGGAAGQAAGEAAGSAAQSGIGTFLSNPEFLKGAAGAVASGMSMPGSYEGGPEEEEDPYGFQSTGPQSPPGLSLTVPRMAGSSEFNYQVKPNYGLQMGGEVPASTDKDVVQNAVAAIKGQHPDPEIALGMFLQMYGEAALQELISSVERGDFDANAQMSQGEVRGPMMAGDMVPAQNMDTGDDIMLETGEYVMPRTGVAAMGGGDHAAGIAALDEFNRRARV